MVRSLTKKVKAARTIRIKELASVIGKLSATRPQHEEASLYLARLNGAMWAAIRQAGWEGNVTLTQDLLSDLGWWTRTLKANVPNSIEKLEPSVQIDTDASESGWGSAASAAVLDREIWSYGLWSNGTKTANCMREFRAVRQGLQTVFDAGILRPGQDVRVRCDNTNVVYNINRKRAGWRMRKELEALVLWGRERQIRIECR